MSTAADMTATQAGEIQSSEWWLVLLQGIASLLIGILLITDPSATLVTLAVFLGIYWFISGIFDLVRIFIDHTNWGWRLFSGILGILAGLVIIRHPLWASLLVPATLVWVLGIIGIIIGAVSVLLGFQGGGWGAGIMGAISIIFGILLLAASPLVTIPILVFLAAGWAIVAGIFEIIFSFRLRRA
jgi:uncharacterized membrane protein HdeD (DUF308 family)